MGDEGVEVSLLVDWLGIFRQGGRSWTFEGTKMKRYGNSAEHMNSEFFMMKKYPAGFRKYCGGENIFSL